MARISVSYNLLNKRVRRWIWQQGWDSLKEIQENAIPTVLAGNCDVIISAPTAGGKTEAAFLPILTAILQNEKAAGYQVLYISPLKALINDQYRRLEDMTTGMDIDVTPWHGDINVNKKAKSLNNPNGIILITPESLESFLINRNCFVKRGFSSLKYVVIDELHSFIGSERGKQLQSLLSRIEQIIHRRVPRIAMSATFSEYESAKYFLRQDGSMPCFIPSQGKSNHEVRINIKEYVRTRETNTAIPISLEIFNRLRGSNNLVFTNNRIDAEKYAVLLSDMCAEYGVPNEFRVHHGSLSRIERETVEYELQKGEHPVTAICTSTLELGVDIGKVKSIAQIGTASSVSSLRQRLGRSGRRNEPSLLRVFSIERNNKGLLFDLRSSLVQNIAIIELMREHRYEKPSLNRYHFSTLIQQILAIIAQFGGFYPKDGWLLLCQNGAFKNVTSELFLELLKSLGKNDVISQLHSGLIVIGEKGERILKHPDFYVAFISPLDLIVINKGNFKRIGMIQFKPKVGTTIILAGKRWLVESYNEAISAIYVSHIDFGGSIMFSGDSPETDCIITQKMKEVYLSSEIYPYLDEHTEVKEHLKQSRCFFFDNNLGNTSFIQLGGKHYFINWLGTKTNRTLALFAHYCLNKQCDFDSFFISNITKEDINILKKTDLSDIVELASMLPRQYKIRQKYDYLLSDKLLNLEFAYSFLEIIFLERI